MLQPLSNRTEENTSKEHVEKIQRVQGKIRKKKLGSMLVETLKHPKFKLIQPHSKPLMRFQKENNVFKRHGFC